MVPSVLLGDRCHCCGSGGGGFCDCTHQWPSTIKLYVPGVTPRTYLVDPNTFVAVPVTLPASITGVHTLNVSDTGRPPGDWEKVYSVGTTDWRVYALRPFPGSEIIFGVYFKYFDGTYWILIYKQVIGCRGAFPVGGDSTSPPIITFDPDALHVYAPFTSPSAGVYVVHEPEEPVPADIGVPPFPAYFNLSWQPCPVAAPSPGAFPDGPAYVDFLHLQLPASTLTDRNCCNAFRGRFVQASIAALSGSDGGLAGLTLGGAMPVTYGGASDFPFCCRTKAYLRGYLPPHNILGGAPPLAEAGLWQLVVDESFIGHLTTTAGLGAVDANSCTTDLVPHGDCSTGSVYYDLNLYTRPGVEGPAPTCETMPAGGTDPCGGAPGFYIGTVRMTLTGVDSLAGEHRPGPNVCDYCP